ncbi:chromate ion transporter-like protein [Corynespora cassiicola Philippines]|uniref:Chromate ion transporter-like protein n=1 Tax=Corynespora cassiicola Philippines TaxID=1448308 RepID=A0A2T2NCL1_CORCC|nr:chromate ion transporter-like protein [Corynespora cassiicola Philippines]
MPLLDIYRAVRDHTRDQRNSLKANDKNLAWRLSEVFARMWDLGFTAFGGPPVHFGILYSRFVDGKGGKSKWIDEQTYQELFAVCQALPGPGSTKMLFCIAQIHAGVVPAIFAFLLWSLPGAIGMYALSLGIQNVPDQLPPIAYALLSGLNASTVGIIALAAVQLADKAIKDQLTRILVIFGACAGLCYNALWYFPVLILIGGIATLVWDLWLQQKIGKLRSKWDRKRRERNGSREAEESTGIEVVPVRGRDIGSTGETVQRRSVATASSNRVSSEQANAGPSNSTAGLAQNDTEQTVSTADTTTHGLPIKVGVAIIVAFFVSFVTIMILRGTLEVRTLAFDLFANMYLAGTIIFGGGPVVIPLLREYVVQPGWVSPRDFLLGLAIIQAFPGPNFNFGVFLGALALASTNTPTVFGALLGYIGMFLPGLSLALGVQSLWRVLRTKPWIISLLRGINATAVGLVFTAVYRLWEIGYLTPESINGKSLAGEPWWVVVAALTYAESAWFDVPPALAIVIGAVLGLGWFGAVGN